MAYTIALALYYWPHVKLSNIESHCSYINFTLSIASTYTLLSYIATTDCSDLDPNVTDNYRDAEGDIHTTISWDATCGCVDFYTLYYTTGFGLCHNVTLNSTTTSKTLVNGQEMQIAIHQNDIKTCLEGVFSSLPNPKETNTAPL